MVRKKWFICICLLHLRMMLLCVKELEFTRFCFEDHEKPKKKLVLRAWMALLVCLARSEPPVSRASHHPSQSILSVFFRVTSHLPSSIELLTTDSDFSLSKKT